MVLTGVAACQPKVIIDLAGLEFIDSSGVAALACVRKHAPHQPAPRARWCSRATSWPWTFSPWASHSRWSGGLLDASRKVAFGLDGGLTIVALCPLLESTDLCCSKIGFLSESCIFQ